MSGRIVTAADSDDPTTRDLARPLSDALEALWAAMGRTGKTPEEVRDLCEASFGVRSWSELVGPDGKESPSKQWGLVLLVDPEAKGPEGFSMEPFA